MLQEALLVARNRLPLMYTDSCDVYTRTKSVNSNGVTKFTDTKSIDNCPCRLSYNSAPELDQMESAAGIEKMAKLFLDPDVSIPEGSYIVVTRDSKEQCFRCSGSPKIYESHQEISLEYAEDWA